MLMDCRDGRKQRMDDPSWHPDFCCMRCPLFGPGRGLRLKGVIRMSGPANTERIRTAVRNFLFRSSYKGTMRGGVYTAT